MLHSHGKIVGVEDDPLHVTVLDAIAWKESSAAVRRGHAMIELDAVTPSRPRCHVALALLRAEF